MEDFKPSANFVNRTMAGIRAFESEQIEKKDRLNAFLLSRRMRLALSAGGVLLGVWNLIRMASTLIAPALCF